MRKINSTFLTEFISEEGNRLVNRDYFAYVELDDLACYVLADGIDDDEKQNSAEIAVKSILKAFSENPSFRKGAALSYIKEAQKALASEKEGMRLQASVVVVITNYIKLRYYTVGNTRFSLYRNDRILKQSQDQSLTEYLLEAELVSKDKAALHEERNNLAAYLGMPGKVKVSASSKIKLEDADSWFLYTRGVWEFCDEGELSDAVKDATEPKEILDGVEDLIMSKQPEALDNYTLAVTFVDKVYKKPQKKITLKKVLMIAIPILVICLALFITWFVKHRKKVNRTNQMNEYIVSGEKYTSYNNYKKASDEYTEALALSKTLKLKEERDELDQIVKLINQILSADEMMRSEKYKKALESYQSAYLISLENGNIGKDYIESQLKDTLIYIEVIELIEHGDELLELEDMEQARSIYQQAKELSNQVLYHDGRKEAGDKIAALDEKAAEKKAAEEAKRKEAAVEAAAKAAEEAEVEKEAKRAEEEKKQEEEEQKQQQEEEEKKKQEEEAAREEAERLVKEEIRMNALEIEREGNEFMKAGDYINAVLYFETAKELYKEIEMDSRTSSMNQKIKLANQMSEYEDPELNKAYEYMEAAVVLIEEGAYSEALVLYRLAHKVLNEKKMFDDARAVNVMIGVLEGFIKNQVVE